MGFLAKYPFIPEHYQEIIIEKFQALYHRGIELSTEAVEEIEVDISPERMLQFVFMGVFQLSFGFTRGGTFSLLDSEGARRVKEYIAKLDSTFPGQSTAISRMGVLLDMLQEELMELAEELQDGFYTSVGNRAREAFKAKYASNRSAMTPPPETFVGLIRPSKLFPDLTPYERGVLVPYFNAKMYQRGKRISSTAEWVGELKTPSLRGDSVSFLKAAKFGFFGGTPGKNTFYAKFRELEARAPEWNDIINKKLSRLDVLDLTIVSVDGTNIPVDKRDTTGSIGTGSRGSFFGHKSSIACDARCIPINQVLDTGRSSDLSLFSKTLNPVKEIEKMSDHEIWCVVSDAAYSELSTLSKVEKMKAIPLIDINPKNSSLLKKLKNLGSNLMDLTRKALYAIPKEVKEKFRNDLRSISRSRTVPPSLEEKKSILRAVTSLLGREFLEKGLSKNELKQAQKIRENILSLRRNIRKHGTTYEKKIGLTPLIYGTLEWLLVYSVRGQNEGINGILKKRGDLIGDGQHTSWLVGRNCLSNRVSMDSFALKYSACVNFTVTGKTKHLLRALHNWRHTKEFFYYLILVIICR